MDATRANMNERAANIRSCPLCAAAAPPSHNLQTRGKTPQACFLPHCGD
jgi:hypothetical protein